MALQIEDEILTVQDVAGRLKVQATWVYEKTRARSRDKKVS
jgi:hypothetical protein